MKALLKMLIVVSVFFLLSACNSEATAEYPDGDITLVVPNAPGGGTDIVARGLVEYTQDKLDANIIVENNTEGGGITGLIQGANADPDGYTLTMATVELAMLPHLDRLSVTHEDFQPIVAPIADPAAVIVPADAPYDTMQEFIDYAQENPGLRVGNSGMGAVWHLAAVALEDEFGIEFSHVPYDEGSAPAVSALAGGHIDAITVAPSNALSQINAGELKVLGIMGEERLDFLEDVPTLNEEFDMDFAVRAWAVLSAPADTPSEVMDVLNEAFIETTEDPEFQEFLSNQGIDPVQLHTTDMAEIMADDHDMYESLMEQLDL